MAEPSRSNELRDLLEEARRAGAVESAGRFTLDYETAIAKLRGFQVENPYHYVNRLLRAAQLDQAHEVHIQANASKTRVSFPVAVCEPDHLDQLFEQIFQNQRPAARELGTATNLALSTKPERIEIQVLTKHRGKMLQIAEGATELFDVAPGSPRTVFQLQRPLGPSLGNWGELSEEYLSILRRFRFSPIAIRVNGERLEQNSWWGVASSFLADERVALRTSFFSLARSFPARHHVAELRIFHGRDELNAVALGPSLATGFVHHNPARLTHDGRNRCFMAIGLCADSKRTSVAHFVYQGETLQSFPTKLPGGTELVISCDDLHLDVSGEKLNQDEAFQARWRLAKDLAGSLFNGLIEAYPQRTIANAALDPKRTWVHKFKLAEGLARQLET